MFAPPTAAFAVQVERLTSRALRSSYVGASWGEAGRSMLERNAPHARHTSQIRNVVAEAIASLGITTRADAAALLDIGQMHAMHVETTRKLLGEQRKTAVLLDVGAASGGTTSEMAQLFHRTAATEASAACCRRLRARRSIDFVLGPQNPSLDNPDLVAFHSHYDAVALLNVLDRCDNPYELLRDAILRVCTRNMGKLLCAFSRPLRPFVQPQGFFPYFLGDNREHGQNLHEFFAPIIAKQEGEFEEYAETALEVLLDRCSIAVPERRCSVHKWTRSPYLSGPDNLGEYAMFDQLVVSLNVSPTT